MADSNLSAILFKKQDLRLVERPIPEPKAGEVQIRMQRVGVCASDVHFWQDGRVGDDFVVKKPLMPGHECSGIVTKVGDGVTHIQPGDRVAIEPLQVCRACDQCKKGRYNLCPNAVTLSIPPNNGALARYHVHSAHHVFKLPDNVSFEEGALIEPLSVGLHACQLARVTLGDKVLVCGAGPIGLCALLAAKAYGASAVCVTDIDKARLAFAKEVGATHTLHIEKGEESEDVAKKISDLLGDAPNRAIECSGAQFSVHLGVNAMKPGGVLTIVGLSLSHVTIPIVNLVAKEVEIVGSYCYINTWPIAIDMISSGKINVAPLVSHRFKLGQTVDAFEKAKSGEGIKVMIDCTT